MNRAQQDYPNQEAAEQLQKIQQDMLLWQEERERSMEERPNVGEDR